jgi:hypothetical protein
MYSVKPGRGPSLMGGVGGIAAAVFGIIWTGAALSMGAPIFFALFGLVFVGMAIAGAIYNFYNATNRDRMSTFDVTTDAEEGDPIATALGYGKSPHLASSGETPQGVRKFPGEHCPFCGAKAGPEFNYCPKCGKDI